jgi:hypothetical protein
MAKTRKYHVNSDERQVSVQRDARLIQETRLARFVLHLSMGKREAVFPFLVTCAKIVGREKKWAGPNQGKLHCHVT